MHPLGRLDPKSILPNSAECVLDYRLAAVKPGTPDHFFVFRIDAAADAQLNGAAEGEHQDLGRRTERRKLPVLRS